MLKRFSLAILVFISFVANSETLMIGSLTMNPPFESIIDAQPLFFGFEIDMAQEICHRIGADCQFKAYLLDDLLTVVREGQVDLGIGAFINPGDRLDDFLHTFPYLPSYVRFMTLSSSPLQTVADIHHKKIGIRQVNLFHTLILENYDPDANIIEFPTMAALLDALVKHKIDTALINSVAANYWYANNSGIYKLLGKKIQLGFGYAAIARRDNVALVARINQAILSMQRDGSYQAIYNRYFSGTTY